MSRVQKARPTFRDNMSCDGYRVQIPAKGKRTVFPADGRYLWNPGQTNKEQTVKQQFSEWKTNGGGGWSWETSFEDLLGGNVTGTPEQCVEKIPKCVDLGVTHFTPHFLFELNLKGTRIFRDDVVPAFK